MECVHWPEMENSKSSKDVGVSFQKMSIALFSSNPTYAVYNISYLAKILFIYHVLQEKSGQEQTLVNFEEKYYHNKYYFD